MRTFLFTCLCLFCAISFGLGFDLILKQIGLGDGTTNVILSVSCGLCFLGWLGILVDKYYGIYLTSDGGTIKLKVPKKYKIKKVKK